MSTMIFVNLSVKDLDRAKEFYTQLGFSINSQFTDENASSVVISDTIYVMLLTEEFMRRFTSKQLADAHTVTEAINALGVDSREAVDDLADRALAAGGTETRPAEDQGFMYSRAFADPDGHQWESVYMDPGYVEG